MLAQPPELAVETLVGFDDVVDRDRALARRSRGCDGHAYAEIAPLDGGQYPQHRPVVGLICGRRFGGHYVYVLSFPFSRCRAWRYVVGTQNSTLAPAPGSLTMRHQPPASWARSFMASRPRWPGIYRHSSTTKPVPSSLTSTTTPPSSAAAATRTRVACECFCTLVRASAT